MFKLMHKKLNKKGFTLAELLIVVAIVAILVAIAIPIFTSSLTKAQLATNEANIRSTKAAAISIILENWTTKDYPSTGYNGARAGAITVSGKTSGHGWVAFGRVDKNGDLADVKIQLATAAQGNYFKTTIDTKDVYAGVIWGRSGNNALQSSPFVQNWSNLTNDYIKFVHESGSISPDYWTIVYISEAEINGQALKT